MKPDPETRQMPKRSIKDDQAKSMTGGVKPKPRNQVTQHVNRQPNFRPDRQLPKVPPEVGLLQAT